FGFQFVCDPVRRTKRNLPVVIGLEPHPVNGPALLSMTEWIANGGAVGALPGWLASQGILTRHGRQVWRESTIRDILHNPTNWGGRRSHTVRSVPRPEGVRRASNLKTRNKQVRIPYEQQKPVADGRVQPIPGLTRELWERALTRL